MTFSSPCALVPVGTAYGLSAFQSKHDYKLSPTPWNRVGGRSSVDPRLSTRARSCASPALATCGDPALRSLGLQRRTGACVFPDSVPRPGRASSSRPNRGRSTMRARAMYLVAAIGVITACVTLPGAANAATVPPPVACNTAQGACWHPALNARWQYQLQGVAAYASTGGINVGISATPYTGGAAVHPTVFDIDLYVDQAISGNNTTFDTAAVNAIHAAGGKAICYLSAGTWENWRVDANQFPASVLGSKNGWPGEKWLDIRQTSVLLPIMDARVQKCRQAGFDGVEWDNVDGYSNRTGFPLTANDQLVYDASLANLAHQYGLTVAMKNDVEQVPNLASYFDYAINEQCQQYNECGNYTTGFINAGKTVFQVEYKLSLTKFCPQANAANRNAITKSFDLFDTPWTPCR